MAKDLLDIARGIHLRGGPIGEGDFTKYQSRVAQTAESDCCYGADCGDCDCGGYCIDSECA